MAQQSSKDLARIGVLAWKSERTAFLLFTIGVTELERMDIFSNTEKVTFKLLRLMRRIIQ